MFTEPRSSAQQNPVLNTTDMTSQNFHTPMFSLVDCRQG